MCFNSGSDEPKTIVNNYDQKAGDVGSNKLGDNPKVPDPKEGSVDAKGVFTPSAKSNALSMSSRQKAATLKPNLVVS